MVYQKRSSTVLEKALARLQGLQSLDPQMQLGNGLSLQDYANLINLALKQLEAYNLALATADRDRIEFAATEASVTNLSSRLLSAVAATYGKDSKEYELAGGKLRTNYQRSKKTATTTDLASTLSNSTSTLNGSVVNGTKANGV
ncbi:MAG TPA: hypothetical protein V6C64_01765 [Microcoleaceae cyanobacterium]|jgi:hypothetical protein